MTQSEQIWQEYHARLRSFIRGKIADEAAADDILQDVFLKMHASLPSLKDATKLQSWLYQIARNAIIDSYRQQKPTVAIPDWLTQTGSDSGDKVRQELSDCLLPMVQQLPDIYRDAINLAELQGLKQKEVAEQQGISLSNAKSRVQRGRALLKEMLEECCLLEFDHQGRLCDYERRNGNCATCS